MKKFLTVATLLLAASFGLSCGGDDATPSGFSASPAATTRPLSAATPVTVTLSPAPAPTTAPVQPTATPVPPPPPTQAPPPAQAPPAPPAQAPAPAPPAAAPSVQIVTRTTPVRPGQTASLTAKAAPNAACSISYVTPAGTVSQAQGLVNRTADSAGNVSWSWVIGTNTNPGTGNIRVTCGGVSASTSIQIG